MPYTIQIRQPFLWWTRTTKKQASNTEEAASLLSQQLGTEVKPADLHMFLFKEFIIGGRRTITLHKR